MSESSKVGASMLEHGAEMLKHLPSDAVETARELAGTAFDGATQLVESTSEHVGDLSSAIVKVISRNPVRTACVALSVGCVLGILLFSRR